MDGADSMMEAFTAIAQMLGGGAALLTGLRMDRTRKLERLLDKIAGDRDNIPLDELFAAAGIDAAKGRTVVESAISHGYFGADAYIDNRTNTLVVRGAAPQPPRKPKPAPAPEPAPADQYTAILQQLRCLKIIWKWMGFKDVRGVYGKRRKTGKQQENRPGIKAVKSEHP